MKLGKQGFYCIILAFILAIILVFSASWDWKFIGDDILSNGELIYGSLHVGFNIVFVIGGIIGLGFFLNDWMDIDCQYMYDSYDEWYDNNHEESDDSTEKNKKNKNFKVKNVIVLLFSIIALVVLSSMFIDIYKDTKNIYNTHVIYSNQYKQKIQEREMFYDKMWKTYLQKEKISNINKETFITVTKTIMESRADGKNLLWKWNQENQYIPYSEFTKFYTDLSSFITSQREDYFKIETQCQVISNQDNVLLDTFPNNIYNKILKLEKLEYNYGFTSDSTQNVFKTKKENLK